MKDSQDPVNSPDSDSDLALITTEPVELAGPVRQNFNGINVGGNTVTQNTAHFDEEIRTILRAIFTVGREKNWTQQQLQLSTGLSSQLFYAVWTGRYTYPLKVTERYCPDCKKKIEKLKPGGSCILCDKRNVVVTEKAHPKAGQPREFGAETIKALRAWKARQDGVIKRQTDFVEITAWNIIERVARRAFDNKRMAFVLGESHYGKTTAGRELARRYNSGETTYVDTPPSPGKQLMLKMLARALNVANTTCFDKLLLDVIDALDPSKQIVFDNFHRVLRTYQKGSVVGCMDTILYIYDQSGCSMVVMATPQFQDGLRKGEFSQYLKQFESRGVYTAQIDPPTIKDLNLLAARQGLPPVPAGEARDTALDLGQHYGLGLFCTRLSDAVALAKKRNEDVEWRHFLKANAIALKLANPSKTDNEEEE